MIKYSCYFQGKEQQRLAGQPTLQMRTSIDNEEAAPYNWSSNLMGPTWLP
jgi:hypothetical protein